MSDQQQTTNQTAQPQNLPPTEPQLRSFSELREEMQTILGQAEKTQKTLKEKTVKGETVDAASVLVKQVLPLLQMLGKNTRDLLTALEDADGDDGDYEDEEVEYDEDGNEIFDDGGDDDEYEYEDEDGDEDFVEIPRPVFERVAYLLNVHGFQIPNGNTVPEEQKSPAELRSALAALAYSAEPDSWPTVYQALVAQFPNVPFQQEMEEAAKKIQEAQRQQPQQGDGGQS